MNKKANNHSLPVMNANAAGIDVGASFHVVALPPNRNKMHSTNMSPEDY